MKKTYIAPMTEITSVNISSCLMQASVKEVTFSGFGDTPPVINVGGTTDVADSRSSVWDDDDDF